MVINRMMNSHMGTCPSLSLVPGYSVLPHSLRVLVTRMIFESRGRVEHYEVKDGRRAGKGANGGQLGSTHTRVGWAETMTLRY